MLKSLSIMIAAILLGAPGDEGKAQEVLRKANLAHGEFAVKHLRGCQLSIQAGDTFQEMWFQSPDRMRIELRSKKESTKPDYLTVIRGNRGWSKFLGSVDEL